MQYIKALVLIVVFFVAMLFLCQNQASLAEDVTLQFNVLFQPEAPSVTVPFYLVVAISFAAGLICCFLLLVWERVRISAKSMRTVWKVRKLENEQKEMAGSLRAIEQAPMEERTGLYEKCKSLYEENKKARQEKKKKDEPQDEAVIETTASEVPTRQAAGA